MRTILSVVTQRFILNISKCKTIFYFIFLFLFPALFFYTRILFPVVPWVSADDTSGFCAVVVMLFIFLADSYIIIISIF